MSAARWPEAKRRHDEAEKANHAAFRAVLAEPARTPAGLLEKLLLVATSIEWKERANSFDWEDQCFVAVRRDLERLAGVASCTFPAAAVPADAS